MGQKSNPHVIRFVKTNDWSSKYIEKKSSEFYLNTVRDLEIKKYVEQFFKTHGLIIQECKINYSNSSLQIFIAYQQNLSSTTLINNINKDQKITLVKVANAKKLEYKKTYNNLLKSIKKCYNYESLSYKKDIFKKPEYTTNNLKKIKRIKTLNYYKKYLNLKKNKIVKNLSSNTFLNKFFKGLTIFHQKPIYLIFKPLNDNHSKNINKKNLVIIKKRLIKLKKYQRNEFFKEGVNLVFSIIHNKNSATLLANFIALTLKKLKRHNFFLRFIKTILNVFITKRISSVIQGIKIKIKGRLNGVPRAKHKIFSIGESMSILTLNSNINYAEATSYTSNGTVGVKIWVAQN